MIGSYQHALVSTSIHNDDSYVMCSVQSSAQMILTWYAFALILPNNNGVEKTKIVFCVRWHFSIQNLF